jgi:hypothetical protein
MVTLEFKFVTMFSENADGASVSDTQFRVVTKSITVIFVWNGEMFIVLSCCVSIVDSLFDLGSYLTENILSRLYRPVTVRDHKC